MSKIISFQGELGANSHTACLEARPEWEVLPCPTFEDAFAAVNEGPAGLAMIPIENSIAGRVADIHHLLPTSGLHIVGEHFLPIHFHLMAIPEADLGTVKDVYSTRTATPVGERTRVEVERFFDGLELVEPGVTWLPLWRPTPGETTPFDTDPSKSSGYAGVGRLGARQ